MSRVILLVTGLLLTSPSKGQDKTYDNTHFIEWDEFYQLRWSDFQGHTVKGTFGDAGTAIQIKAKPYLVKKKVMYNVYVLFDKKTSWSKAESDALLAHEQLHFDIAEVYARKVRKKISELQEKNVDDIKEYNEAIHKILEESNVADRSYDIETLHGALRSKQALWQEKIMQELSALINYKKPGQIVTTAEEENASR